MPKIMVIDDSPPMVTLIATIMKKMGNECITAYSGEEALEKLEGEKPDLILLDIMMPGMDGIETCDRIKDNPETADIPIFMVTAKTETESQMDAIYVRADGYITKPFHVENMMEKVRKALDKALVTGSGASPEE